MNDHSPDIYSKDFIDFHKDGHETYRVRIDNRCGNDPKHLVDKATVYVKGKTPAHIDCAVQIPLQTGTVKEGVVNGLQPEHLIAAAQTRIEQLDEKFPSPENKEAIERCKQAICFLNERTAKRKARGVEGKHVK